MGARGEAGGDAHGGARAEDGKHSSLDWARHLKEQRQIYEWASVCRAAGAYGEAAAVLEAGGVEGADPEMWSPPGAAAGFEVPCVEAVEAVGIEDVQGVAHVQVPVVDPFSNQVCGVQLIPCLEPVPLDDNFMITAVPAEMLTSFPAPPPAHESFASPCFRGPPPSKETWNCCWDYMKHGWCKRGDTCRWEHPAPGFGAAPPAYYWSDEAFGADNIDSFYGTDFVSGIGPAGPPANYESSGAFEADNIDSFYGTDFVNDIGPAGPSANYESSGAFGEDTAGTPCGAGPANDADPDGYSTGDDF